MVKVKSQAEIDKAYREAIGRVPAKYKEGIQRTTDWQERAASEQAEANYAAGVQEAINAKRRAKAISQVSNAEWQQKAANLGAARIATGMSAGAEKRTRNFEPYRTALENLTLSPRTTDPLQNVERVKEVVKTMVETKKSIKG